MKLFWIIIAIIVLCVGFSTMGIDFIFVMLIGFLTEPLWKKLIH
jgi:hypothetical protein